MQNGAALFQHAANVLAQRDQLQAAVEQYNALCIELLKGQPEWQEPYDGPKMLHAYITRLKKENDDLQNRGSNSGPRP